MNEGARAITYRVTVTRLRNDIELHLFFALSPPTLSPPASLSYSVSEIPAIPSLLGFVLEP